MGRVLIASQSTRQPEKDIAYLLGFAGSDMGGRRGGLPPGRLLFKVRYGIMAERGLQPF
jgi:hypothetical protein